MADIPKDIDSIVASDVFKLKPTLEKITAMNRNILILMPHLEEKDRPTVKLAYTNLLNLEDRLKNVFGPNAEQFSTSTSANSKRFAKKLDDINDKQKFRSIVRTLNSIVTSSERYTTELHEETEKALEEAKAVLGAMLTFDKLLERAQTSGNTQKIDTLLLFNNISSFAIEAAQKLRETNQQRFVLENGKYQKDKSKDIEVIKEAIQLAEKALPDILDIGFSLFNFVKNPDLTQHVEALKQDGADVINDLQDDLVTLQEAKAKFKTHKDQIGILRTKSSLETNVDDDAALELKQLYTNLADSSSKVTSQVQNATGYYTVHLPIPPPSTTTTTATTTTTTTPTTTTTTRITNI